METSLVVMREVWGTNLGNALVGDEMKGRLIYVLEVEGCRFRHWRGVPKYSGAR